MSEARTPGLDHVSVTVGVMARSLRFYHELLGLPIRGQGREEVSGPGVGGGAGETTVFRYADLDLGRGQILELLEYERPRGRPLAQDVHDPGSGHLGLRVERLEEALGRLKAAGFPARGPPITLDGPEDWRGARVVYVTDPDGVTVELVEGSPRAKS
jgi:catechol 2,3-dioxygenase-like lactoylglutathione lyase family enzyme